MPIQKILIVEDEPKVAAFIKKGLEENEYNVTIANDGVIGKDLAINNNYNLIILDINLPFINGFQLCKIIREHNTKVPILMLTALSGIDEKVKGFDNGADDYLLKPFEFMELLARIKVLLKRTNSIAFQETIEIGDIIISKDSKSVTRAGKSIVLSAKEYALLEYLAINKGRVINRNELLEKVWGLGFDPGTNVVDVYINFLRKKIDMDFTYKIIHTKVGMGYILIENEEQSK